MGRRTWASLPPSAQPLPGRFNIVLSTTFATHQASDAAVTVSSLPAALALASSDANIEQVFVIGGASVYSEALAHPCCIHVHVTRVYCTPEVAAACDTFFQELDPAMFICNTPDAPLQYDSPAGPAFQFVRYDRIKVSNN